MGENPPPRFPADWERRRQLLGPGLTVIRGDQCPYIQDAVAAVQDVAEERGIPLQVVEMHSAEQVQNTAPSPYGVSGILLDGAQLGYHYLLPKDIRQRLDERSDEGAC